MAINWTQVNVPTILAVLGVGWGVANYISRIDNRVENNDTSLTELSAQIDMMSKNHQDIPYRVMTVEKGLDAVGRQQDRLSELILTSVEGIRKDVSAVGTKVEVLSSKMDDVIPQRKTMLEHRGVPVAN